MNFTQILKIRCHSSFDMSRMCARTGRGRPTIDSPPDPLIPHPPPYPTPGPSHPPPLPKQKEVSWSSVNRPTIENGSLGSIATRDNKSDEPGDSQFGAHHQKPCGSSSDTRTPDSDARSPRAQRGDRLRLKTPDAVMSPSADVNLCVKAERDARHDLKVDTDTALLDLRSHLRTKWHRGQCRLN